jgi:hypothetical protein
MKISASIVVFQTPKESLIRLLQALHVNNIVIDNSPFDKLGKICAKFPKTTYLHVGKNIGFGAGHNRAVEYLDNQGLLGEFHLILNPDITLFENTVEILAHYLSLHPNVGLVAPKILNPNGTLQPQCRQLPTPLDMIARRVLKGEALKHFNFKHEMQYMDYEKSFEAPFIQASCWMVRSQTYKQIGGFDERFFLYMEDVDFCRRIAKIAKIIYYPQAQITHEWGRGSQKSLRYFVLHVKSALQYFLKHTMR